MLMYLLCFQVRFVSIRFGTNCSKFLEQMKNDMDPQTTLQDLLRRQFTEKNQKNIRFSLRSFSSRLGISPGAMSELLNGRRRVSKKIAARITERLLLDPKEQSQILSQFRDPIVRKVQPDPTQLELNADQFKLLSDWHHFAILTLMETSNFIHNKKWIARRLKINSHRVREALDRLLRLQLIKKSGKTLKRTPTLISSSDEITSASVQKAHGQYLENAEKALHEIPIELRDFTSIMLAIDPDRLPEAKKMIRKFQNQMERYLEKGNRTEVYQMCIQLFPLTEISKSKIKSIFLACLGALALLVQAHPVSAGTRTGNGGGGWVCRESVGKIRWMILADLFEATEEYGLFLDKTRAVKDETSANSFLDLITSEFNQELKPYLEKIQLLKHKPPYVHQTDSPITPTEDAHPRVTPLPESCRMGSLRFEQIVDYKDDGMIVVQKSLFRMLSPRDKTALILHEAIYALRRDRYGDTDSDTTRRLIALIFSTIPQDSPENFKKSWETHALWMPAQPTERKSVDGTVFTRVTGHPEWGEAWQMPPTREFDSQHDSFIEIPGAIWTDVWDDWGIAINVPHEGMNGIDTRVNFTNAKAYCETLGAQLPTWLDVKNLARHLCPGHENCGTMARAFPILPWASSSDSLSKTRFWTSTRTFHWPKTDSSGFYPYKVYNNYLDGRQFISAQDTAKVRCVLK